MNMFYRVLPSFTGFYLVLPGRVGPETGVYRVLPRFFCFKVGKRSKVFYFSLSLSLRLEFCLARSTDRYFIFPRVPFRRRRCWVKPEKKWALGGDRVTFTWPVD